MKVKELMIGDWFHNNYTNENYQVWPTFLSQATNSGRRLDATFEDMNITPIPITSYILEKNGFEYKEKEIGLYGVITAPHYVRDDVPFEVFCDGEPFAIWFRDPVNIKYVHQLQHALRLCGIEKEIEL